MIAVEGGEAASSNRPLFIAGNGRTTCLLTTFELDKSLQFETGVTCIKQTDGGLLIMYLVDLTLQKYIIKISHQNTHNFDVHFCKRNKSESPAQLH